MNTDLHSDGGQQEERERGRTRDMILELGTSLESAMWEGREGEFLHEIEALTHVWNDVATAILFFPVDVYFSNQFLQHIGGLCLD